MRYLISTLLIFVLSYHNCYAQNQKIKLSEIINSIYFSQQGLDIKDEDEQMFFFMTFKKNDSISLFNDILEPDCYNSRKFEILYSNEEKKILKKLKKVEYGNVVRIQRENNNTEQLKLIVDIGMTDYNFYKKTALSLHLREIHGKSITSL